MQEHEVERETDGTEGWGRETERSGVGGAHPRQSGEERDVMVVATRPQLLSFTMAGLSLRHQTSDSLGTGVKMLTEMPGMPLAATGSVCKVGHIIS